MKLTKEEQEGVTAIRVKADTKKVADKIKRHMDSEIREGVSLDSVLWVALKREEKRLKLEDLK